jgi:SAM-dependent methyltransferase
LVGLAEYLPFTDASFAHALFSTSLDHFVGPRAALREAGRVVGSNGEVDVWLAKGSEAPRWQSPEWYRQLEQPELADDLFHIKRLTAEEFRVRAHDAGLRITDEERQAIDTHRRHWFFRLRRA